MQWATRDVDTRENIVEWQTIPRIVEGKKDWKKNECGLF